VTPNWESVESSSRIGCRVGDNEGLLSSILLNSIVRKPLDDDLGLPPGRTDEDDEENAFCGVECNTPDA